MTRRALLAALPFLSRIPWLKPVPTLTITKIDYAQKVVTLNSTLDPAVVRYLTGRFSAATLECMNTPGPTTLS